MKAYLCNYKSLNGTISLYVKNTIVISPSFDKPGFRLSTTQDIFELYNQNLEVGELIVLKELEISDDLVNGILNDQKAFDESKKKMEEKGRTLIEILFECEKQIV